MKREEMIQALNEGKRVRHRYFLPEEWLQKKENGGIYSEDGVCWGGINDEPMEMRKGGYWEDGWELFDEEETKKDEWEDVNEGEVLQQAEFTMFRKPYIYIVLILSILFWWLMFK